MRKKINPVKNLPKENHRQIAKEKTQMTNKHIDMLRLWVISELQEKKNYLDG